MRFKFAFVLLVLFFSHSYLSSAQRREKPPQKTRILFLLDASGSMHAEMGSETRINVAKHLLSELVDSLSNFKNLEVALRVYGHLYEKTQRNCQDSRLEVPFGKTSAQRIQARLQTIVPKGTTPIAYSLEQTANDFPKEANVRNVVIIITDGLESCDGDPCAVARALQSKNIFLKPFVVGVGNDADFKREFSCLGQYFNASNKGAFKTVLRKIVKQTLSETTVKVELTDGQGRRIESDINMTFVNNVTKQSAYDYVHWRDGKGQTDKLDIDAVLSYDLIVNTIPPVIKENIYLEGGGVNVITLKTPQGKLAVNLPSAHKYGKVPLVIYKDGRPIHKQDSRETIQYLEGNYRVEALTTPVTVFKSVNIKQGQTTTLKIDAPGIITILDRLKGHGTIYKIEDDGRQQMVYQFDNIGQSFPVQPGNYKVVVRSGIAKGADYTVTKMVNITPNGAATVKIF